MCQIRAKHMAAIYPGSPQSSPAAHPPSTLSLPPFSGPLPLCPMLRREALLFCKTIFADAAQRAFSLIDLDSISPQLWCKVPPIFCTTSVITPCEAPLTLIPSPQLRRRFFAIFAAVPRSPHAGFIYFQPPQTSPQQGNPAEDDDDESALYQSAHIAGKELRP